MTTSIHVVDAKEEFLDLVHRVSHNEERVLLMRREKPVAALVSMEDFALIEQAYDKKDLEEAVTALQEARAQGAIDLDVLKAELL